MMFILLIPAYIEIFGGIIALKYESIMIVWKPLANSITVSKVLPRSAKELTVIDNLYTITTYRKERN